MSWNSECCQCNNNPRIPFEENGRYARFKNDARQCHVKTKVDDCLIKTDVRADGMLSKPGVGDVIIELKGRDVNHAAAQILETAAFCTRRGMRSGRLAGLIVAREYPKITTVIQRAQDRFAATYKGPLHVVTKSGEFVLENVLSFKGPHKA